MTTTIEKTLIGLLLCGLVAAVALPYPKLAPRPQRVAVAVQPLPAQASTSTNIFTPAAIEHVQNIVSDKDFDFDNGVFWGWIVSQRRDRMETNFGEFRIWAHAERQKALTIYHDQEAAISNLNQAALKAEQEPK